MTTHPEQTRILKFRLGPIAWQDIIVPAGSEPLHLGLDNDGELSLWLACPLDRERTIRRIQIVMTGEILEAGPLATAARFIGTVAHRGLILHVLDLGDPADDPGPMERFDALRRGEAGFAFGSPIGGSAEEARSDG